LRAHVRTYTPYIGLTFTRQRARNARPYLAYYNKAPNNVIPCLTREPISNNQPLQ